MVGQVGFITLLIILAAVLGGLALDRAGFELPEQPLPVALALGVGSIVLMILVARKTVARIKTESAQTPDTKEEKIAKDS
jgi:membrane protein implicated in regulation of membrane protease activity